MPPIFIVAWVMSTALTLLIGVGIVTYIRRTWQQIRLDSDESRDDRLLDGIDQLQTQLYMVAERLGEIERQLSGGDGQARLQSGGADPQRGALDATMEDVTEEPR